MGHKKRSHKSELSRILGVTPPVLSKFQHDPSFPEFDKDNNAEIYAVCVWWYLRKEANPVPTDEALLAGDDSDGLERYRQARAAQEEIKLAQTRGQVVMLDKFEEAAQVVLGPYRRIGEHCKRIGDTDMMELISEANKEIAEGLERLYGLPDATIETEVD